MYRETYRVGKLTYHHVVLMAVLLAIKIAYSIIPLFMDKHFDGKKCRLRALSTSMENKDGFCHSTGIKGKGI
jgi:hypothetical protein